MSATTIVFAREDLSVPGAELAQLEGEGNGNAEMRFFDLLRNGDPDAVVIDLTRRPRLGVAAILKIRRQSSIPVLVVCDPDHPLIPEYRIAGAAECIPTPLDIVVLNTALQRIIRVMRRHRQQRGNGVAALAFAGFTFYPDRDLLAAGNGAALTLTTSESRILSHFVSRPRQLCTRAEIAEVLYGQDRSASDRAIDVVIIRLRHKCVALRGAAAQTLIKTEFRRGYMLVAAVSTVTDPFAVDVAA